MNNVGLFLIAVALFLGCMIVGDSIKHAADIIYLGVKK